VNHACASEHAQNRAQVQKIRRHLVGDEPRLAGELADAAGVFVGNRLPARAVEPAQVVREAGRGCAQQVVEERELARTVHGRMAREDLLDEARARARHADDEERHGAARVTHRRLGRELRGEQPLHRPHLRERGAHVVARAAAREQVRLAPVAEGALMLPELVRGLAQSEGDVHALLVREVAPRVQPFERMQLRVLRREAADVREVPPGA
jgi:hypothetical protein